MAKLVLRKLPSPPKQPLRKLPPPPNALVPAQSTGSKTMKFLSERFGITDEDAFKIEGARGFVSVSVRKPDGRVLSQKFKPGKRFKTVTVYDKNDFTLQERREVVKELHASGFSQSKIAEQIGCSQPTVSLDLKYLRDNRKLRKSRSHA